MTGENGVIVLGYSVIGFVSYSTKLDSVVEAMVIQGTKFRAE